MRSDLDKNWHTNRLFPDDAFDKPFEVAKNTGGIPLYSDEGFLLIQNSIARQFTKMTKPESDVPKIKMQRLPYPSHTSDSFLGQMQNLAPIFILFGFTYTFMNTVRFVSTEKEKQLKEAMKIMGLPMWIHWFSWFVRTIFMFSISVIGIIIFLKVRPFDFYPFV